MSAGACALVWSTASPQTKKTKNLDVQGLGSVRFLF